jgi:hypothetical protein
VLTVRAAQARCDECWTHEHGPVRSFAHHPVSQWLFSHMPERRFGQNMRRRRRSCPVANELVPYVPPNAWSNLTAEQRERLEYGNECFRILK